MQAALNALRSSDIEKMANIIALFRLIMPINTHRYLRLR